MPGEGHYRFWLRTALVVAALVVGLSALDYLSRGRGPGDAEYLAANRYFEDGLYEQAVRDYRAALVENPEHLHARRGLARALMQLGRNREALAVFDEAILAEPGFGATYANRGILQDRMGEHARALADYEQALALDPELAEGPHWLTRFLRNQPEPPPTIADRARYLREQLALPEEQRLLSVPQVDTAQRPYKQ